MNEQRNKVRRRMRGIATFFLVISILGGLGSLILITAGDQRRSFEELIGVAAISIGLFFAALASWNGSRIGAFFVIILNLLSPLTAVMGIERLSAIDWMRAGLYFVLAVTMFISAIQYRAATRTSASSLGGTAWLRWVGTGVSASVVGFLGLGFLVIALGSSTAVLKGSDLSSEQIEWLSDKAYLTPSERPLYAYIDGLFNIEDGGSLLTDEYVGGWWTEEGQLKSVWIKLGEVCEVKTLNEGSAFQNAIYSVHAPGDESWVELWLSTENNLHSQFISRMKTINDRKMRPEIQSFCDEGRPIDWVEIASSNGISQDIVDGADVPEDQRAWMRDQNFLLEGEEILSFYSYGKFSIAEEGTLLTDQYFGGWATQDEGLQDWWMELGAICDVRRPDGPNASATALYRLLDADEDTWIDLRLPTKNDQARILVDRVIEMSERLRTDAQKSACDARGASQ